MKRVDDGREHLVLDPYGLQSIARGFARFSHHGGDGLANVSSFFSGQDGVFRRSLHQLGVDLVGWYVPDQASYFRSC